MAEYKNILTGYVNERQDGTGHYLVLTNVSDEDVTIKAGEKLYLNRTPAQTLKDHPKVPHYSKSIKIEDNQPSQEDFGDVSNDVPF